MTYPRALVHGRSSAFVMTSSSLCSLIQAFLQQVFTKSGQGSRVLQRENADANKSLRASSALAAKDASRELAKCSTEISLVLGSD